MTPIQLARPTSTSTTERLTGQTTCSMRSGLLLDSVAASISVCQTRTRHRQGTVARDKITMMVHLRVDHHQPHCPTILRDALLGSQTM